LLDRLGIVCVADVVRRGRLRWFGHVERKMAEDWVSKCRNLEVESARGKGRGRKTWNDCVEEDLNKLKLKREDAQDREGWKRYIMGNRLTRASTDKKNRRKTMIMMMMMMMMVVKLQASLA
jgi:hypothetical protein